MPNLPNPGDTPELLATGNASNAGRFLYWDTVHPTSRVHDIFAARAAAPIPEPGGEVILFLFGTGFVFRRRRPCV